MQKVINRKLNAGERSWERKEGLHLNLKKKIEAMETDEKPKLSTSKRKLPQKDSTKNGKVDKKARKLFAASIALKFPTIFQSTS